VRGERRRVPYRRDLDGPRDLDETVPVVSGYPTIRAHLLPKIRDVALCERELAEMAAQGLHPALGFWPRHIEKNLPTVHTPAVSNLIR
jgi:hypothetical protein